MPTNPPDQHSQPESQQDAVDQCQRLMAHAWMVRTFIKHSEEVEDFPELMGIVRAVFDTSRALETRLSDPAQYLKMLRKKIGSLKVAVKQFAEDAPHASTHTNFQQAVLSIQTVTDELDKIAAASRPGSKQSPSEASFNAFLREQDLKVVFAESCTGGLLSSKLVQFSGISDYLFGSAVTYQNATKSAWLNVAQHDLDDPEIGPVSKRVVEQMLSGVLAKTPQADFAVAVSGHLGPTDDELDGIVYIGYEQRGRSSHVTCINLNEEFEPKTVSDLREQRRRYLVDRIFQWVIEKLSSKADD